MPLSTKLLRTQLSVFKPFMDHGSVSAIRRTQLMTGRLMAVPMRSMVYYAPQTFHNFGCAWITPKERTSDAVILYLHGGGYVAGGLEYAKGFGTTLAIRNRMRVFCVAYRLAPEAPYPAALDDAVEAYQYLLGLGYPAEKILLCGESAGGGLVYALSLRLKALSYPLPGGLIGISPWTDLTSSSKFYELNRDVDPSMSKERLQYYAALYTISGGALDDPYISPLFGNLAQLPPSLIFAGGDEVMLGDAVQLHEKLIASGCLSRLIIAPEMWHVYPLYGLPESRDSLTEITRFVEAILHGTNPV